MNKNLHPIMLAGTGSDVGKSIITAALCLHIQARWLPSGSL